MDFLVCQLLSFFGEMLFWLLRASSDTDAASCASLSYQGKANPVRSRWRRRGAMADKQPSNAVQVCAQRLSSSHREDRQEAARLLGELNDRAAVPALIRALDRNLDDLSFRITVIHSLAYLGDERALPALRRLTTGHTYSLMEAARKAVSVIEQQSVLLRAGSAPSARANELLRPASGSPTAPPRQLLRASDGPPQT